MRQDGADSPHQRSAAELGSLENVSSKQFHNHKFPPDDIFGGNCFKKRAIHGPAVRGRAVRQEWGPRRIKNIKARKSRGYPISLFAEALKHAQRLTAGLRSAPPFGRRLGLGPSLAQSRRLLRDRSATAAPSRVCPVAQPFASVTSVACATAAPLLRVRKPAAVSRNCPPRKSA